MTEKTFICRCEDLTLEEIQQAIEEGFDTIEELKGKLRLGMGPCQGRGCLTLTRRLLCQKTGKKPEEITMPTTRPPTIPVSLGTIVSENNE